MAAYLVYICKEVTDRRELEIYWDKIGPTLAGSGVENLAGYTRFEKLEGEQPVEGLVVASFPSMEAARAWYHGPKYAEVRPHRLNGGKYLGLLVEGGLLPREQRMPQTLNAGKT
jgi:uncharacterized protein (DUF1330 family)